MHFARTEEQDELASIVRSLLDKHSDSAAVRSAIDSELGYDEALWRSLCEQVGVGGAARAGGVRRLRRLSRRVGAGARGAGSQPHARAAAGERIATAALLLHADPEHRETLIPRIAAGEVATVVLDELTLDAPAAAMVLRLHDGHLELLQDPQVESVGALDQTMRFGRVEADEATTIGMVDDEGALRDIAAALTSALQVGAAQRGLDMTVAYSLERVQFGRPIGSFQALKHRMADMLVLVEASRSASWGASAAAAAYVTEPTQTNRDILRRRSVVARSYCSDALDHVASETVQLHGGIAITWEHDAQLLFKRAHALNQLWQPAHEARASLLDR